MKTFEQQILNILKNVDRPGAYCAEGVMPFVMPGLEVKDVGTIPLPLTEVSARALIAVCRQAPYGRGTKTVVDTNVRKVWELDPQRLELRNPAWQSCVDSITAAVQKQLGLGNRTLVSQLYKLLIYEKGGFFLPHKDGEKIDRMVATLIVALPSKHSGGELIIRHANRETVIRFDDPAAEFQTSFAAFYADCEHEVKPVKDGYRLCLVYNLVLADTKGANVSAPDYHSQTQQLVPLFELWKAANPGGRLAIGLTHEYSAEGLSLQNLKGEDQSRALIIAEAAVQAGCRATLGLMTLWESGLGEDGGESYDYYDRRRSRHYSRERSSKAAADYRMIEIYDSSLSVNHWAGFDGSSPSFGELIFRQNQLISEMPILDRTPEEDFEGYTGNAGMTLQRWYRQAIVAVWPQKAHYKVLCAAGTPAVVQELLRLARELRGLAGAAKQQQREECRRFAGAIISRWKVPEYSTRDDSCNAMLRALQRIGSRKQFLRFLDTVVPRIRGLTKFELLARMCRRFGWQNSSPGLKKVFAEKRGRYLVRNGRLLRAIAGIDDQTAHHLQCSRDLTLGFQDAITVWALQITPEWEDQKVDTISVVVSLIDASGRLQNEDILRKSTAVVQALSEKLDPVTVQIPAALQLISESRLVQSDLAAPVREWLQSLQMLLEQRTAVEPQPPADFTRDAVLDCKCTVCKDVNRFLQSPTEETYTYRARQNLRQHLESQIRYDKADLSTETIRKGSPQSLLCRKTKVSWKHRHDVWKNDNQSLALIREFLSAAKSPAKQQGSRKTDARRTAKKDIR